MPGVLYQVISDFTADNADMNPEKISAIDMGYVFENLVQRFLRVMMKLKQVHTSPAVTLFI